MCVYTCVWRPDVDIMCLLQIALYLSWGLNDSLNLEFTSWLDLLASNLLGSSCPHLLHDHIVLFMWVVGLQTQVLLLSE